MPQPSAVRLGDALREATRAAGVTQKAIAEAVDRDQSTVSAWVSGENWAPLWALPIIDELCGQPRGHVLRLAGYVDDDVSVEAAIAQDPNLDDASKGAMVVSYRAFAQLSTVAPERRAEAIRERVERATGRAADSRERPA